MIPALRLLQNQFIISLNYVTKTVVILLRIQSYFILRKAIKYSYYRNCLLYICIRKPVYYLHKLMCYVCYISCCEE